jgi:aromatic ring hydroxylase-like protein
MPDFDLVTADGLLRVFTLLHDARPVLLNLGEPDAFDITRWADRVELIEATCVGMGASGTGGHCSRCGVDSARRIRGLGGRPNRPAAPGRANHMVGTTHCGVAHSVGSL